ncbi:MAG: TolC family protein, partial [Duncaniella sp.]|nr:TolC family protein [Duncaniella sp.]
MKRSIILCGLIGWAVTAAAATPFDEVVAEILDNNPTIRIVNARSQAQVEQTLGENTLESPEIEFGRLWGANDVGNKWSLSVSQSFDWPGVYAARRQAAASQSLAGRLACEAAVMDVRLEVRNALIDLIHNAQLLTVQRQLVAQLEDFVDNYRRGVEQGSETRLDLNRAVIELIGAKGELNSLQASRSALLASLQALNGDKDVEPLVARLGEAYPIVEGVD